MTCTLKENSSIGGGTPSPLPYPPPYPPFMGVKGGLKYLNEVFLKKISGGTFFWKIDPCSVGNHFFKKFLGNFFFSDFQPESFS